MKKICLYLDFSPKYMVNFFATTRFSSLQSLDIHSLNELDCFNWINTYSSLLEQSEKNFSLDGNEKSSIISKRMDFFKNYLLQRDTIYRYFFNTDINKYRPFVKLLKNQFSSKNITFQAIVNIGRYDIVAEQFARISRCNFAYKKNYNEKNFNKNFIPRFINFFEHEFGKENLIITCDSTASPLLIRTTTKSVRDIIGFEEVVEYPNSFYELKTKQARELWNLFCINNNRYLSTPEIMPFLKKLDSELNWDSSYELPYSIRKDILDKNENTYKWLSEKYFGGKELFEQDLYKEEEREYTGIKPYEIIDFLKLLPSETKEEIHMKYSSCYDLLTSDEKNIYKILENEFQTKIKYREKEPKLSVLTLCYNHEKYIAECIESIQAQQTSFPIKHIIVDHASTDKSQEIIANYTKKYSNIVPYFFNVKEGEGANVKILFKLADTEYVVICDGDDYFTDKHKLQKQVEILEANPDYGLCFHPVSVVYEDGTARSRIHPPKEMVPGGLKNYYELTDLLKVNFIQTNSVMYRWRFADGLPSWFNSSLIPGDWYWHLLHAELGKIGFINEIMSVYRRHTASLYYGTELPNNTINHRLKFGERELEVYNTLNEHFNGKYEEEISNLSNGVFSNFLQHYMDTQDRTYIDEATHQFPQLGKLFLHKLNTKKT